MSLDKVALKALAIEFAASLPPPPPPETDMSARGMPVLLQSPRARAIRRIAEIANMRGWQIAVARALDVQQASYVDDLPDDAVYKLRDRMEYFEECVQCACDPEDGPPAK